MSGNRVGPRTVALLEDALVQAGSEGLGVGQLRERFADWSRCKLYGALKVARMDGRLCVESQHPISFYFHHSVPEATRRAAFERRLQAERDQRGYAQRQGMAKHLAKQGRQLRAPLRREPRRPVRAVDPNALRPEATVTWPEGLQVQKCPGYRSLTERIAAECKPAPLPKDPPSGWVRAVLQARTSQTEER